MTARSWFALAALPATGRPDPATEFARPAIRAADPEVETEEEDDDEDDEEDDL